MSRERMRAEQPELLEQTRQEGTSPLVCPHCGGGLAQRGGALRCPNGHSFDVAREGYVNLTVGRHPGDTKAMLRARRAFLEAGHYAPLSDAINQRIAGYLQEAWQTGIATSPMCALDAGCGEGYYCARLADYLVEREPDIGARTDLYGLDIARDGVQMAARRTPVVSFVVGNIKAGVPFRRGSLTALLNVFAPRHPAEFARVIAPGGLLLIVIPRPEHLGALRARLPLLAIQEQKREQVLSQFAEAFTLYEVHDLVYEMALSAEEVALLVAMTPTRRQTISDTPAESIRDAQEFAEPTRVTAAFTLLSLRRKQG